MCGGKTNPVKEQAVIVNWIFGMETNAKCEQIFGRGFRIRSMHKYLGPDFKFDRAPPALTVRVSCDIPLQVTKSSYDSIDCDHLQ